MFLGDVFGNASIFHIFLVISVGLPLWLSGIKSACQYRRPGFNGWEDSQKEEATHCTILAWEIRWTEELVGLQSIGSQSRT